MDDRFVSAMAERLEREARAHMYSRAGGYDRYKPSTDQFAMQMEDSRQRKAKMLAAARAKAKSK